MGGWGVWAFGGWTLLWASRVSRGTAFALRASQIPHGPMNIAPINASCSADITEVSSSTPEKTPCRMTIGPYLPVLRARFFSPPIHHRLSFQFHFNFISKNPEIWGAKISEIMLHYILPSAEDMPLPPPPAWLQLAILVRWAHLCLCSILTCIRQHIYSRYCYHRVQFVSALGPLYLGSSFTWYSGMVTRCWEATSQVVVCALWCIAGSISSLSINQKVTSGKWMT